MLCHRCKPSLTRATALQGTTLTAAAAANRGPPARHLLGLDETRGRISLRAHRESAGADQQRRRAAVGGRRAWANRHFALGCGSRALLERCSPWKAGSDYAGLAPHFDSGRNRIHVYLVSKLVQRVGGLGNEVFSLIRHARR